MLPFLKQIFKSLIGVKIDLMFEGGASAVDFVNFEVDGFDELILMGIKDFHLV